MFPLSESAQSELLTLCRNSLQEFLKHGTKNCQESNSPELLERRGVFVTLHTHGELRGCIGVPEPVSPLFQAAQECALSAARSDPRFSPMTEVELPDVKVEISVLSPLEAIGKHRLNCHWSARAAAESSRPARPAVASGASGARVGSREVSRTTLSKGASASDCLEGRREDSAFQRLRFR